MNAEAPTRIAHFRLDSLVAQGGVGVVYRAIDETLDRTVAIKVLADPTMAERLIVEARAVSQLNHPSIAAVYEAGVCPETDLAYVAFEWVEGASLRALLRTEPLPLTTLLEIAHDLTEAVSHAHERGIVHGDLKADNVVVGDQGGAKLLDFGLAAPLEGIREDEFWGTPACMAPELLQGGSRNEASDLFALGVLLYEMATGALPFGGEDGDPARVQQRFDSGPPRDPHELRPELPLVYSRLVLGLLERDVAARGPSAAEAARILRLEKRRKSRVALLPLAFVALVLIGAPLGWSYRDQLLPVDPPAPVSVDRLWVSTWVDPASGVDTPESRFGADLIRMFLGHNDPGSALLSTEEGEPAGRVHGRWGRTDAEWEARWQVGDGPEQVATAGDPVRLARAVVTQLPGAPPIAESLTHDAAALRRFTEAVRIGDEGRLPAALDIFEALVASGPSFPEARAWLGVYRVLYDRSEEVLGLGVDRMESAPARVLAAHLAGDVRHRSARWGASHRVARLLDLHLDWSDPATTDDVLTERVSRASGVALPIGPRVEVRLARGREDYPTAIRAVERLRTLGVPPSEEVVLLESIARSGADLSGVWDIKDWLLDHAESPAGREVRMGFELSRRRLERAVKIARDGGFESGYGWHQCALILGIGGDFDEALTAASSIRAPLDYGAAARVRAAILALRGDLAGAEEELRSARSLDPERREPGVLLDFVLGDPYSIPASDPATPPSRFLRWRQVFVELGNARRSREAGDLDTAESILARLEWADVELRAFDWPEAIYLAWLERIHCLVDRNEGERARADMYFFRRWWPVHRPEASRVSRRANELDALLDSADE